MTEYERFMFDLKGWVVIPDVLTRAEVASVSVHIDRFLGDPGSLPVHQRAPVAGDAEILIDHPRVLGVVTAVLDPDPERVRLESVFASARSVAQGSTLDGTTPVWRPHGGGANLNPSFSYRVQNGCIYAGMTRVVFELHDVVMGQGGTCFVSGSHRAELPFASARDELAESGANGWPAAADEKDSGCWETYGCKAGSMVVFSEATRHTGAEWTHRNPNPERKAVLMAYNLQSVRHHEPKPYMNKEVIAGLSTEARRGFFKEVWQLGNG